MYGKYHDQDRNVLVVVPFLRPCLGFSGVASEGQVVLVFCLDLDFGNSLKSLGCLRWGILWAIKEADQFWSKVAPKAFSEELNELSKSNQNKCAALWAEGNSVFIKESSLFLNPFPTC